MKCKIIICDRNKSEIKETIWEKLYKEAMDVINPHEVSSTMWVGSVASAVLTKKRKL